MDTHTNETNMERLARLLREMPAKTTPMHSSARVCLADAYSLRGSGFDTAAESRAAKGLDYLLGVYR